MRKTKMVCLGQSDCLSNFKSILSQPIFITVEQIHAELFTFLWRVSVILVYGEVDHYVSNLTIMVLLTTYAIGQIKKYISFQDGLADFTGRGVRINIPGAEESYCHEAVLGRATYLYEQLTTKRIIENGFSQLDVSYACFQNF